MLIGQYLLIKNRLYQAKLIIKDIKICTFYKNKEINEEIKVQMKLNMKNLQIIGIHFENLTMFKEKKKIKKKNIFSFYLNFVKFSLM